MNNVMIGNQAAVIELPIQYRNKGGKPQVVVQVGQRKGWANFNKIYLNETQVALAMEKISEEPKMYEHTQTLSDLLNFYQYHKEDVILTELSVFDFLNAIYSPDEMSINYKGKQVKVNVAQADMKVNNVWIHNSGLVRIVQETTDVFGNIVLEVEKVQENITSWILDPNKMTSPNVDPGYFKNMIVDPSELILLDSLLVNRRDDNVYQICGSLSDEENMTCGEEFVYIIHDMPESNTPMVLTQGENSKQLKVIAAWLLWDIKTGKRYTPDDVKAPVLFDVSSDGIYVSMNEDDILNQESSPSNELTPEYTEYKSHTTPSVQITVAEIMAAVNKEAPYWNGNQVKFADLGLSNPTLQWTGFRVEGRAVANVTVTKGDKEFTIPVTLVKQGMLDVNANISESAKATICRFVSYKAAERKLMAQAQ